MMKSNMRLLSVLLLFLIGLLAVSAVVNALPVTINEVKVADVIVSESDINWLDIERGESVDVKVTLSSQVELSNVEVEAFISGYEYNDRERMSDTTHVFDVSPNITYVKKLNLKIPSRVDEDNYLLRIIVSDRAGSEIIKSYKLRIDVARHLIQIKDVVFYPDNAVKAGRALLATVRVKNSGERTEESIKVQVSIPELGLTAADYIDTLESGDSATSEELYLRIPDCFKPGVYEVKVDVIYDEGFEKVSTSGYVTVVAEETCNAPATPAETPKTIITYGPESQDVTAGQSGVVFPITITNTAKDAKTFILDVQGVSDWATTRLTPSNVLLIQGGETKAAYLYVAANQNAPAGQRMFVVSVKDSAGNVLKELNMNANVKAGTTTAGGLGQMLGWDRIRGGLEIALIILVVLLVILLLVLAFNRLRGNEEEESEEGGQTYY